MTREEQDNGEPSEHMLGDNSEDTAKMEDKYYMTYFLFYGLGTLTLIPANFFTTATDYWMYKFRDTNNNTYQNENRTELQSQFIANYSIVTSVSNVAFLVLTMLLIRRISVVKRMIGSFCGVLVMFAFTVVFVEMDTDSWQMGFYVLTLIIGFLLTAFCAVFMVTLFQLAAKFPPGYLIPILSGQSICGILAALVQIFALSIGAKSQTTGLVYFLIAMFFVMVAFVYFLITLRKSEYFKYYINREVETEKPNFTKEAFLTILNKIKFYVISMVVVLGCSIMIHPGVTSLVVSVDKGNGNKWNDVFYVPVTTYLFYNVFDYIGRELAGKINKPKNGFIILVTGIFRIGLVPMLMLCNAQPRTHLPVVFDKDYVYVIIIIVFAFTNGYLMNLCVLQVPHVTTKEEKTIALVVILAVMLVSLGACSFVSSALIKAL